MPLNVINLMKTLENLSSYMLGLFAFFMPKLTDTLEFFLEEVIAKMRADGLAGQANQILYSQEQQVVMEEMELTVKWIGVCISIAAALFLYLKDIKSIHAGLYYFWTRISCFIRVLWRWIANQLTNFYLKLSCFVKKAKRTFKIFFSKNTHNH